ncbi:MAG: GGDEF domain-containing protein [Sphingomonas sp.]|nr:GGDEF domain-containing protein [Sphingomonas sp.]
MYAASGTPVFDRLRRLVRPEIPGAVRDELALRQSRRLHDFLPMMCVLVAANSLAMAYAILGDLPWWQQAAPPVILTGTCLAVLAISRFRPQPQHADAARRQHRYAIWTSGAMGLVSGLWCVNAFTETEQYYCMTAPVFTGIAAIIASTCLLSVPRAAIAGMVGALAPITVKLMTYEYSSLRAMAVMLILLTAMQASVVLSKFRETVAALVLEKRLEQLAEADPLTGLDNRLAFERIAQAEMDRAAPLTLLLADLDGFKPVNDTHGHQAGDAVLIAMAKRMRAMAPAALSVARIGGDEFAILLPGNDPRSARDQIEAISVALTMPVPHEGKRLRVGASFGAAASPEDAASVAALMHAADMRLYTAKEEAREAGRSPRRDTIAA